MAQLLLPFVHFLLLLMRHPLHILQPLLHVFRAQILLYLFHDGRAHAADFISARLIACCVSAVKSGISKLSSSRLPESFFSGRVRVRFCSFFSRITVTAAVLPDDDRRACVKSDVSWTG